MANKSDRFSFPEHELAVIRAAIEFANCKVESVDQVEAIFRRVPLPRHLWKTIPAESVQDFKEHDQRELRDWLGQIVEKGHIAPRVRDEVAKRIRAVDIVNPELVFEDGRLSIRYAPSFTGVQACYAYAVALLTSRDRGDRLAKCLGRCEKCGRFFFQEHFGPGRPRTFCSTKHKNAHYVWLNKSGKEWKRPALP